MAASRKKSKRTSRPIDLPKEEIAFIEPRAVSIDERDFAFRFELGREAHQRGADVKWLHFLESAPGVGCHFPEKPWLRIPKADRLEFVTAVREGIGPHRVRYFWPWQPISGIWFAVDYFLSDPEAQAAAEAYQEEEQSAAQDSQRREFRHWRERQELDLSRPIVKAHIDLSTPDTLIVKEFRALLGELRKRWKGSPKKRSGQTTAEDGLRQLAAARLLRLCGSLTAAENYLEDRKIAPPYADPSTWYRTTEWILKEMRRAAGYSGDA